MGESWTVEQRVDDNARVKLVTSKRRGRRVGEALVKITVISA
jgi:hypothetical protein